MPDYSAYGTGFSESIPTSQKGLNHWSEFMGVKVPFFNGPESMARKNDLAVVFLKVCQSKRDIIRQNHYYYHRQLNKPTNESRTEFPKVGPEQQNLEQPNN